MTLWLKVLMLNSNQFGQALAIRRGLKKNRPMLEWLRSHLSCLSQRPSVRAAWLLEKPAAWVGAQRPSMRPREDALLKAERLYHRRLIDHLEACGCKIKKPLDMLAIWLQVGCISSKPTFAGLTKNKKKKKGVPKKGPKKKGKGFLWQSLTSLEMQPGAKLQRRSTGHYSAAIPPRSALDFACGVE